MAADNKKRKLDSLYEKELPKCKKYEKSYMHRDVVTHVAVSKFSDFVITGSNDGVIKFWKKIVGDIEFVKLYQAHTQEINDLKISYDGKSIVTTSSDKMIKIFDVTSFDMVNMLEIDYIPTCSCWIPSMNKNDINSNVFDRVVIGSKDSGILSIYDKMGSNIPTQVVDLHYKPVLTLCYNHIDNVCVSGDLSGMLEYWCVETLSFPDNKVDFEFKMNG